MKNEPNPRSAVVRRALQLLSELHQNLSNDPNNRTRQEVLFTSHNRRLVDGLLDLISLEGIYPNLLPGVGVPIERRLKSVLQGGTVTQLPQSAEPSHKDDYLLLEISTQLSKIAMSSGEGLCGALQERILVDLIAAKVQLTFSSRDDASISKHDLTLKVLLDRYVSPLTSRFF